MNVLVKYRVKPAFQDLAPPVYASEGAAGADLRAAVNGSVTLAPGARAVIPTGLVLEIPHGFEGQVRARSGLVLKHGLALANGVGTIDADYRGEVQVILANLSPSPFTLHPGDRIAQLVVARVERAELVEAEALGETTRGPGGFGSTGQ